MRERKAEHRAPPHSPTFLWKSSQTTAIGGRDAAQQSSTHRSAGTTLAGGKRRVREREKSMCHFGACQLDTGSSFQPAGRKSAATDLFSSPLLWIGRPSPRRASQPGLQRDHSVRQSCSAAGPQNPQLRQGTGHVTDRNNNFLAAPGVDWTFSGRSYWKSSVVIGCEVTTCFSMAAAYWMFVPCVLLRQLSF